MPEYLAPGVYIEEVPFRSKPIEGVSTSTAGFVGPARFGPIGSKPCVITSLREFEQVYGDGGPLVFADAGRMHNFLWHAVRAFFAEGGRRLYIARTFLPRGSDDEGVASCSVPAEGGTTALGIQARFPGAAGNFLVRFTVRLGANILGGAAGAATVEGLQQNDVVWISHATGLSSTSPASGDLYLAGWDPSGQTWRFGKSKSPATADFQLNVPGTAATSLVPLDPDRGDQLRIVELAISVLLNDGSMLVWDHLSPDPARLLPITDAGHAMGRRSPLVITAGEGVTDGLEVLKALFAAKSSVRLALDDPHSTESDRSIDVLLSGGNDGARPTADDFQGIANLAAAKTGLRAFEDIEEISIVAAPGATFDFLGGYEEEASRIVNLLITHAERMVYRIAVLDSGEGSGASEVRHMRAQFDSKFAALYWPWVRMHDPITGQDIDLPPSGFVAGIYARNDIEHGVSKAPANQVVTSASGLEVLLNDAQQEVLNPEGINCLRTFEGRGVLVWGARTISSDPEWKYVSVRRYCAYLEHSVDRGTQWTVFEPNGEALWAAVRRNIENFLLNEWRNGALTGDKPELAFFVRCDRSTMTQSDLDAGKLICLVGVAPLRPAEFVIVRIGMWTADRKCC
jgi:uncharacterized protein